LGQSLSGSIATVESSETLGYATVNIYRGDKLVANVLSDAGGNFTVELDTGTYRCEILYAGYEKVTKEIRVMEDEKADFSMAGDESSPYDAVTISATMAAAKRSRGFGLFAPSPESAESLSYGWSAGASAGRAVNLIGYSNMWGEPAETDSARVGRLTAGEINDFSKWDLWTDLTEGELGDMQAAWMFTPSNRYTVQLTDQNGMPLANAKVELLHGAEVLYTSRSDNTGKAELWASLESAQVPKSPGFSLRASYNGQVRTVEKAREFRSRINKIEFNTECAQSQNVDIAIVVDATGSMQDEIDYLKYDLNDVVYQAKEYSSALNLRFANIFYRDLGDAYVTRTQNFTSVLSESVAFVNEHNADGGGDVPEAVEIALDSAINRLAWRDDTRAKILLLVLDAPPHNTPTIQAKMRRLCYKAAEKGIRIVTVAGSGIDKGTEYLMRCVALATNGTYVFLTDHSGVGGSHIKPSTDRYQVEVLNELLTRIIKSYTYMPDCKQTLADLGVYLPDSVVAITTALGTATTDSAGTTKVDTVETLAFEWRFYPNPTDGIVNIAATEDIEELYISDLSGKVVQVIRNIKAEAVTTADLSDYASGIYLIRYPVGKQWVSGQVLLVRS
jgi:hypothetical protein